MLMELHHIGNLVDDIDIALETYKLLFGEDSVSKKTLVTTQGVYVCFINIGKQINIELIQPVDENSSVYRLRKKGISYYHLAYMTEDFDRTSEFLLSNDFRALDVFYSEAFDNKRCQFMYTPEGSLIELIEK
jgi:methylmalonyl-CoA/ethylmalonyl-CoA epimerase